jgi:DNA-binding HxlR family transcriptional regulator
LKGLTVSGAATWPPASSAPPAGSAAWLPDDFPSVGNCFSRACITRSVLTHVTGRWGLLVLEALRRAGVLRFSELRDRIDGVSEKMLSKTLRDLEGDGLILRTSRPVVPPHVDYRLTGMGESVGVHIEGLVQCIESHAREFASVHCASDGAPRAGSAS